MANQCPSSWGSSPAQLELVRLASTNAGCFRMGSSSCWQWQALLRKTCYHSCNTDSVWQSTRFKCSVNFWQLLVTFFFMWNEIFYGIGEKLLLTKVTLLCSIFQTFLGLRVTVEIWHRNKTTYSKLNPVQSSRSKVNNLSKERESAQIWIKQHSNFRSLHSKAWRQCQAWFCINTYSALLCYASRDEIE